jgi:hypothetical protein
MAASYPSNQVAFARKIDLTSTVQAADINSAYDEIEAIESSLGTLPDTATSYSGTPNFNTPTSFGTVSARLFNIEKAAYYSYTNGLTGNGGFTISTTSVSTPNITVSAISSQTANLIEFKNGSSTLVSVSPSGTLQAVVIDGGSA